MICSSDVYEEITLLFLWSHLVCLDYVAHPPYVSLIQKQTL